MPSKKIGKDMICVQWTGNGSDLYDGLEHYIPKTSLLEKSKNCNIGDIVYIKWSGKKVWSGILKELSKTDINSKDKIGNQSNEKTKKEIKQKNSKKEKKGEGKIGNQSNEKTKKEIKQKNSKKEKKGEIVWIGRTPQSEKVASKAKRILFSPRKSSIIHNDKPGPSNATAGNMSPKVMMRVSPKMKAHLQMPTSPVDYFSSASPEKFPRKNATLKKTPGILQQTCYGQNQMSPSSSKYYEDLSSPSSAKCPRKTTKQKQSPIQQISYGQNNQMLAAYSQFFEFDSENSLSPLQKPRKKQEVIKNPHDEPSHYARDEIDSENSLSPLQKPRKKQEEVIKNPHDEPSHYARDDYFSSLSPQKFPRKNASLKKTPGIIQQTYYGQNQMLPSSSKCNEDLSQESSSSSAKCPRKTTLGKQTSSPIQQTSHRQNNQMLAACSQFYEFDSENSLSPLQKPRKKQEVIKNPHDEPSHYARDEIDSENSLSPLQKPRKKQEVIKNPHDEPSHYARDSITTPTLTADLQTGAAVRPCATGRSNVVENVLSSRTWRLLPKGHSCLARTLVRELFSKEELVSSTISGKKGKMLDTERMKYIKDLVRTEYSMDTSLFSSVWTECKISITQMIKHMKRGESKGKES